jgi:uncharacterized membrane protein YiaA
MSKGIATETIAKMLLVIIVVGIVVYIIYKYVLHSPLDEQGCAAMMSAWCGNCELTKTNAKYSGGPNMTQKLWDCISNHKLGVTAHKFCDNAETDCKGFLPV